MKKKIKSQESLAKEANKLKDQFKSNPNRYTEKKYVKALCDLKDLLFPEQKNK